MTTFTLKCSKTTNKNNTPVRQFLFNSIIFHKYHYAHCLDIDEDIVDGIVYDKKRLLMVVYQLPFIPEVFQSSILLFCLVTK